MAAFSATHASSQSPLSRAYRPFIGPTLKVGKGSNSGPLGADAALVPIGAQQGDQGNCRPASLGKVAEGYPRRDAGREGFHMSHEGVARILKGRRAA